MSERRRLMGMKEENLEWIKLGSTTKTNKAMHNYHTANVGFDHPVYGFALLATGQQSYDWCHTLRFSWYSSTLAETTVSNATGWSRTTKQRYGNKQTAYLCKLSSSNIQLFYDKNGNEISSSQVLASSLPDSILINGVPINAKINWVVDEPIFLDQIQCGIYDISKFAILVDKTTPRVRTKFTYA